MEKGDAPSWPFTLVVIAIYVAMAVPIVPLVLAWRAPNLEAGWRGLSRRLVLAVASASYIWFLTGLAFRVAVGPSHSSRLFTTCFANMGLMFLAFCFVLVPGGAGRVPLRVATGSLVVLWLYIAFVNAAGV